MINPSASFEGQVCVVVDLVDLVDLVLTGKVRHHGR